MAVVNDDDITRSSLSIDNDTDTIDETILKVIFGQNVKTLAPKLFMNCIKLACVDFRKCSSDIDLPEGCFDGCLRLTSIVLPGQTLLEKYQLKKYAVKYPRCFLQMKKQRKERMK